MIGTTALLANTVVLPLALKCVGHSTRAGWSTDVSFELLVREDGFEGLGNEPMSGARVKVDRKGLIDFRAERAVHPVVEYRGALTPRADGSYSLLWREQIFYSMARDPESVRKVHAACERIGSEGVEK